MRQIVYLGIRKYIERIAACLDDIDIEHISKDLSLDYLKHWQGDEDQASVDSLALLLLTLHIFWTYMKEQQNILTSYEERLHIQVQFINMETAVRGLIRELIESMELNFSNFEELNFLKGVILKWPILEIGEVYHGYDYFSVLMNEPQSYTTLEIQPYVIFEVLQYHYHKGDYDYVVELGQWLITQYGADSAEQTLRPTHKDYIVISTKLILGTIYLYKFKTKAYYVEARTIFESLRIWAKPMHMPEIIYQLGHALEQCGDAEPHIYLAHYEEAAREGYRAGILKTGSMYQDVEALQDFKKAQFWLTKAAKQGSPAAMGRLGILYSNPKLPSYFNVPKAINWAKQGLAKGNEELLLVLINIFVWGLQGSIKPDYKAAVALLEPRAEGHSLHQFLLGYMYVQGGYGLCKDMAKGLQYLEASAKAGNVEAAYVLGSTVVSLNMIVPNYEVGLYWLRQGAAKGHRLAKEQLIALEATIKDGP